MFIQVTLSNDGSTIWINTDNVLRIAESEVYLNGEIMRDGTEINFVGSLIKVRESPYMIIARIREQEALR